MWNGFAWEIGRVRRFDVKHIDPTFWPYFSDSKLILTLFMLISDSEGICEIFSVIICVTSNDGTHDK